MFRRRRGVVLFTALALMALIGLLVGAMLAASTLARRSAELTRVDAVLTASADYAINTVLSDASSFGLSDQTLGQAAVFYVTIPGNDGIAATVSATRLASGLVWLVADADADAPGLARIGRDGHRRINLVARWRPLGAIPRAALVARGNVKLHSGITFTPDETGDAECRVTGALDAIVGPGAAVTTTDSVRVAIDTTAADPTAFFLGARQLAQLDSARTVVHVHGDTTITGGTFEGILIIDGALTIAGPFTASGLIVATGAIDASVGSLSLIGAMLSFAAPFAGHIAIDLGPGTIRYSSCSVARALRRAVPLRPVRQRSWSELF